MKTNLLKTLSLFILFCSCGSYVQVFDTKTENTKIEDDNYVFENDSVKITYDFWREKGLLSFSIYNKLNKPIYVDWKKSSYINKGIKRNYWEDSESTKTVGRTSGNASRNNSLMMAFTNSINVSSSETIKPEKITFIPPKSNYIRSQFFLLPITVFKVKKYPEIIAMEKLNSSNQSINIPTKSYSKADTPLLFRNFLTLSYTEGFDKEFYVDNEFYISSVKKVPESQFAGYRKNSNRYELDENGKRILFSPFQKGTSFYLKMQK